MTWFMVKSRVGLLSLVLVACDGRASGEAPAPSPTAGSVAPAAGPGAKRADKDVGYATVTMDGAPWAAERCTARIKPDDGGEKLALSCSRTTTAEGRVQREEIALTVKGYAGVGNYTSAGNSHFARVAVDTKAADATADEATRADVVTDSIGGAKVVLMTGAKISVTAAGDAIDGTFAWSPEAGKEGPVLTDGSFHAIVKR